MRDKLLGIYQVMKQMGRPFDSTLETDRFIQATIYLIQIQGIDLRFRFTTHHITQRGLEIYSEDLFECIYEIHNTPTSDVYKGLRPPVDKAVMSIREAAASGPVDLNTADWLMLLASMHFVKDRAIPGERIGMGNVRTLLNGSLVTAVQVDLAWSALVGLGVLTDNPKGESNARRTEI